MPLSISSSEPATARTGRITRVTWALIAGAVVLYASAELLARFGLEQVSTMHRRLLQEARAANAFHKSPSPSKKTVLLLGNSLLLEGVDMERLHAGLEPRYEVQRFVVTQTRFLDWYYGLEALFRHGARADRVVLCLTMAQLVSDQIRGDFSAHVLFDAQDIWPVSRDSAADLTITSGYYLAHFSAFYATRGELRSVLMNRVASSVQQMWHQAVISPAVSPTGSQLIAQSVARLGRVNQLCNRYGAEFVLLVPPTQDRGDFLLARAGAQAGVTVVQPISNSVLSTAYYQQDGFHLNRRGAQSFTDAIIREWMK